MCQFGYRDGSQLMGQFDYFLSQHLVSLIILVGSLHISLTISDGLLLVCQFDYCRHQSSLLV